MGTPAFGVAVCSRLGRPTIRFRVANGLGNFTSAQKSYTSTHLERSRLPRHIALTPRVHYRSSRLAKWCTFPGALLRPSLAVLHAVSKNNSPRAKGLAGCIVNSIDFSSEPDHRADQSFQSTRVTIASVPVIPLIAHRNWLVEPSGFDVLAPASSVSLTNRLSGTVRGEPLVRR